MNIYFRKFQKTGKIEDYLNYVKHKNNVKNDNMIDKGYNNGTNRRDNS